MENREISNGDFSSWEAVISRICNRPEPTVFFLLGRTGAGKTTLAKAARFFNYMSVFPGVQCRARLGEQFFAQCFDSVTPYETEEMVRNIVADAVNEAGGFTALFVDGFPRSVDQVRWSTETCARAGVVPVFVYVRCADDVRITRLTARAQDDTTKRLLDEKRNEQEPLKLLTTIEAIANTGCEFFSIDNTESQCVSFLDTIPDRFDHVSASRTLKRLIQLHTEVSDMIMTKQPGLLTMEQLVAEANKNGAVARPYDTHVVWLRRFLRALHKEVDEALAELPDEWWTCDLVDMEKVREELVDILHFFLSAVSAAGMNADTLWEQYEEKRNKNIERQKRGSYQKRGATGVLFNKMLRRRHCVRPVVYLAGPIQRSFEDNIASAWCSNLAQEPMLSGIMLLNPLVRRLEDVGPRAPNGTYPNMKKHIQKDIMDIFASDMVFSFLPVFSAGAHAEIFQAARQARVPVTVVHYADDKPSVWALEHASAVYSIQRFEDPRVLSRELATVLLRVVEKWRHELDW